MEGQGWYERRTNCIKRQTKAWQTSEAGIPKTRGEALRHAATLAILAGRLNAIPESSQNSEFFSNWVILMRDRRSPWQNIVPFRERLCGLDCSDVIDR